jgi:hypothetical protein
MNLPDSSTTQCGLEQTTAKLKPLNKIVRTMNKIIKAIRHVSAAFTRDLQEDLNNCSRKHMPNTH